MSIKTLFLLAALLSSSLFVSAATLSIKTYAPVAPTTDSCDAITFKNGRVVRATVVSISKKETRFRLCNNPRGPIIVQENSDIAIIRYANGTTEDFSAASIANIGNKTAPADQNPVTLNPAQSGAVTLGVFAILASVLGIFVAGIPLGILAIVLGIIGSGKATKYGDQTGKTLNVLGIVFGAIVTLATIIFLASKK
jgi:hypothetical protein